MILPNFSFLAGAAVLFAGASCYGAAVASIDWDNSDTTADGVITGMLGGVGVTLTTGTDNLGGAPLFPVNGGVFLDTGTNWASNLGSDDVPGISDPGIFNEAAVIDMGLASSGRTIVAFSQPVTDPTILINFVHDNFVTFDFDNSMPTLILVDSASLPGGGVIPSGIGDGNPFDNNLVFINSGEGDNSADSGFAVRLTGSYSQIPFFTSRGENASDEQTVAFTVVATIPEPSSFALISLGVVILATARLRRH